MSVPTNEAFRNCLWCDLSGGSLEGSPAEQSGASPGAASAGASAGAPSPGAASAGASAGAPAAGGLPSGPSAGAPAGNASGGASPGAASGGVGAKGIAGGRSAAGAGGSVSGASGSGASGSAMDASATDASATRGSATGEYEVGGNGAEGVEVGMNAAEGTAFLIFRGVSGHPCAADILGAGDAVAHANEMGLTLVPRRHVTTIVDLPAPEMADVLAGLTRATAAMRELSGVDRVEIHTEMDGSADGQGHVCFRVEPVLVLADAAAEDGSVVDVDAGTGADLRQHEGEGVAGARPFERVASPRKP